MCIHWVDVLHLTSCWHFMKPSLYISLHSISFTFSFHFFSIIYYIVKVETKIDFLRVTKTVVRMREFEYVWMTQDRIWLGWEWTRDAAGVVALHARLMNDAIKAGVEHPVLHRVFGVRGREGVVLQRTPGSEGVWKPTSLLLFSLSRGQQSIPPSFTHNKTSPPPYIIKYNTV